MDFQFRNVFNAQVVNALAENIAKNYSDFDQKNFCESINPFLENLGFGERSALITDKLHEFLPKEYPKAIDILLKSLMPEIEADTLAGFDRFIVMPQCSFVSRYGKNHYDLSMHALYEMTKRFTAEGDLRTFIELDVQKTLQILEKWAFDPNPHVRRLVSEGTRPRLPLGKRIKLFQEDPTPVLHLLDLLKDDKVLYVRRSVANNLNDIAKDNPEKVVDTLKKWQKNATPEREWLIRHASRTLLKDGNKGALALQGFGEKPEIKLDFKILTPNLRQGEELIFEIHIEALSEQALMIDYIVDFVKAKGNTSPKVFKLTKKNLKKGEKISLLKKHSFRPIGIRPYYAGKHGLCLQINGQIYEKYYFELLP